MDLFTKFVFLSTIHTTSLECYKLSKLWRIAPLVGFTDKEILKEGSKFIRSGSGFLYPFTRDCWCLVTNNHVLSSCVDKYIGLAFSDGNPPYYDTLLFHNTVASSATRGNNIGCPTLDVAACVSYPLPEDHPLANCYDDYKEMFSSDHYVLKNLYSNPEEFYRLLRTKADVYLISHPGGQNISPMISRTKIVGYDYWAIYTEKSSVSGSSGGLLVAFTAKDSQLFVLGYHAAVTKLTKVPNSVEDHKSGTYFSTAIKFWRFRELFDTRIETYAKRRVNIGMPPFKVTDFLYPDHKISLYTNHWTSRCRCLDTNFLKNTFSDLVTLWKNFVDLHHLKNSGVLKAICSNQDIIISNIFIRHKSPVFATKFEPFWKRMFYHAMQFCQHCFGHCNIDIRQFVPNARQMFEYVVGKLNKNSFNSCGMFLVNDNDSLFFAFLRKVDSTELKRLKQPFYKEQS
ncbi:hypothetical protein P9112_000368 [Eukaryota sp. TZLM1-RC]